VVKKKDFKKEDKKKSFEAKKPKFEKKEKISVKKVKIDKPEKKQKKVVSQPVKKEERKPKVSDTLKKKDKITMGDTISIKELAEKIGIPATEVIKKFLLNGMPV
jgi:O6-methylguanine-DNA--protein-cysteine methyltransferase